VTTFEAVWFALALLVMIIGIVGCVVPGIPGTSLIFAAAVVHRLIVGAAGAQWWALCLIGGLALVSFIAEYGVSMYGAKTLGASRRGMIGAIVGGLIGLFFGILGILLGPFIGAFAFEFLGGREWRDSAKAGAGATLGLVVGAVGKLACAVAMTLLFAANILWRAFGW
jgi:uncharacterized protein YqgC (DUF456 family)